MNASRHKTDVLIVGAGPAGTAAALDLARAGMRVMLVDRKSFPRGKPCGGGLTNKALEALRYDIAAIVRARASGFTISRNLASPRPIETGGVLLTLVTREEFDHYALQQALAAGASFMPVPRSILRIEQGREHVTVCWEGLEIEADWLIAADGANSQIRRLLLPESAKPGAFAIEAAVRCPSSSLPACFDFGFVKGGYGWVFPKGDHFNMGLYVSRGHAHPSREELLRYIALKAPDAEVLGVQGAPIPTVYFSADEERVAFVGDAAACCDDLFGEGLYGAIISGQSAAAGILSGKLSMTAVEAAGRQLGSRSRYMRFLSFCFYRALPLVYGMFSIHLDRLSAKTSKPGL